MTIRLKLPRSPRTAQSRGRRPLNIFTVPINIFSSFTTLLIVSLIAATGQQQLYNQSLHLAVFIFGSDKPRPFVHVGHQCVYPNMKMNIIIINTREMRL